MSTTGDTKEVFTVSGTTLKESGFYYTLSLIGGKYKILVLYWLHINGPILRFNELKRAIDSISFKSLSNTLKDLESDKLIIRKEYPEIPPKVEYSLTEKGKSLMPIIDDLCDWGAQNR